MRARVKTVGTETSQPSPTPPAALLKDVAKECLWNAKSHLRAAEALAAKGMFGHAVSHLVLAEEELGKGLAYRMVIDEWAELEGEGRGRRVVLDFGSERLEFYLYSPHFDKTTLKTGAISVLGFASGLAIQAGIRLGGSTTLETSLGLEEALATSTSVAQGGAAPSAKPLGDWKKTAEAETRKRDQLKQQGFYVDVEGDRIMAPRQIEQETYQLQRTSVANDLQWFSPFVTEPIFSVLFRRFSLPYLASALSAPPHAGPSPPAPQSPKTEQPPPSAPKRRWWQRLQKRG